MTTTKIEWTRNADGSAGMTWNCVRGCSVVSPGCKNCYAMRQAHRFNGAGQPYEGLTEVRSGRPTWTGRARFVPEMLSVPLKRKKPTTFFVNSMSDLFHEDITNEQIAAVFGVMAACPQHTFQVLTKRAERLPEWFRWYEGASGAGTNPLAALYAAGELLAERNPAIRRMGWGDWAEARADAVGDVWPLPNLHLGVSAEDQQRADERIPHLLSVPAAVRWVSAEPLLGELDLWAFLKSAARDSSLSALGSPVMPGLDWVVVGGESGPGSRQCSRKWLEDIVLQCKRAEVPVFVKQLGARYEDAENGIGGAGVDLAPLEDFGIQIVRLRNRKGGDIAEFPHSLRVRQMPGDVQ